MDENDRREIVAAIGCVDEAVISIDDDRTVCKTLRTVKPDIFANGGDRSSSEIPEAVVCRELGIVLVDGIGGGKIRASSEILKGAIENS
jgi:glycerol-3-phosphate cytidylyltransferase-like family protein